MDLKGRKAIVTGAAKGLGLACAEEFAAHGANVALIDVLADEVAAAAVDIASRHGVQAVAYTADVSKAAEIQAAIGEAADALGGLDI